MGLNPTARIEHIGSTAIPNIETKATVDMLVATPKSKKERGIIIEKMSGAGSQHMKDHPSHIMFVRGYTPTGVEEISYHIHMGSLDEDQLWDRVYFRDYLIENPDIARKYGDLKKELSIEHEFDREAYTEAKGKFIEEVTKEAKEYYTI